VIGIKEFIATIITISIILCALFYTLAVINNSYEEVARLKPYETKSKVLEDRVEYLEDYLKQQGYKF
jgi:large-conductance mechanosensitive channel